MNTARRCVPSPRLASGYDGGKFYGSRMSDLFAPLDAALARYRADVHRLGPPAPAAALTALEGHIQHALPPGVKAFLSRYNGAILFRGGLRIRSTSEVARAAQDHPEVLLFADEPTAGVLWAWASDGQGGHVFGTWADEALVAQHHCFAEWLAGSVAVMEAKARSPRERQAVRLEATPDDPYQQVLAGEDALLRGLPQEAEAFFQAALARNPNLVGSWQFLGDTLILRDRAAARRAWMEAFRRSRLPSPWAGAPLIAAETLHALGRSAPTGTAWEQELERFLEEARDARSQRELDLVVAVARELAASKVKRGKRGEAQQILEQLLGRSSTFHYTKVPWSVGIELARLSVDLGHHDNAENWLRRLRREGPPELQGAGYLLLARVAVTRQEPWVYEILDDALLAGLDERGRMEALLYRVEVGLRASPLPQEVHEWMMAASALAPRVGMPKYYAALALFRGEVARALGQAKEALAAWQEGLDHLNHADDPELRGRIALRLGDLYRDAAYFPQALEQYQRAVKLFTEHEFPTRAAWAMLRLADLGADAEALLSEANGLFHGADLPTGLAASSLSAEQHAAFLEWVLHRGSAHARARRDAQESRGDLLPEDADRPERRLGALRLAVTMTGPGIVEAMGHELEASLLGFQAGRTGPRDQGVLRYVASVDLLAGHPSYAAAQKLLEQLFLGRLEGLPLDALKGAIARSPNAALLDGLLQAVEAPERFPPHTVAIACEILGLRKEEVAFAPLTHLVGPSAPPPIRRAAIVALGRLGRREARDHIVSALQVPSLAEPASLALLLLGDPRGLPFHADALHRRRTDLGSMPGEILGRYGGPMHLPVLLDVARSTHVLSLGAIQGLGLLGHPRAIPELIEILAAVTEPATREVANLALKLITGREEELGAPGLKRRWTAWWGESQERYSDGRRIRNGAPFGAGALIEMLENPALAARRLAYDELVISTGCRLPYDYDGPWRVQRAHLKAWRDWWQGNRHAQPPGSWNLDGKPIQ